MACSIPILSYIHGYALEKIEQTWYFFCLSYIVCNTMLLKSLCVKVSELLEMYIMKTTQFCNFPRQYDVIKWKHFRVTGSLCGVFTGHRWIPHTKASDAELWWFLCLNKWLSKQSRGWWFETPSGSLWHHCDGNVTVGYTNWPCYKMCFICYVCPVLGK